MASESMRQVIETMAAASLRFIADTLDEGGKNMPEVGSPSHTYIMEVYAITGEFLRETAEAMRKQGEDL